MSTHPLPIELPTEEQLSLVSVPLNLPEIDESEAGEHGEVFTRRWVVELILDLCGYRAEDDLESKTIVEPACGSGAFLVPIVERLAESAARHGFELQDCDDSIRAFDLLSRNVETARMAVTTTLLKADLNPTDSERLASTWIRQGDFLLDGSGQACADFVVGNPPYIRMEAIPPARMAAYRSACPTMIGRADIYVGFLERGLRSLRPNGRLGFICADRWMRNAYGARLREMITEAWETETIIQLTDVDAFETDVDAYPAITVFHRAIPKLGPVVIQANNRFGSATAREVSTGIANGTLEEHRPAYSAAHLPRGFSGAAGWPNCSPARLAVIADLEERLPMLEERSTGTKVGIGVATGADKVYIVRDAPHVESDRMLPLAMARDIASGRVEWDGMHLVNPWNSHGLVDLGDWPGLAAYLEQHEDLLRRRHTARSGRWHRTIDRVIHGLSERQKLYIPDFKDVLFPVLDEGNTYPHHNLYWITSERWDLRVLGGLLLSDFANLFIEAYSVRMRGGYLRFQAQYLRRIRLPRIEEIDPRCAESLKDAFEMRDRESATRIAAPLYGLESVPD